MKAFGINGSTTNHGGTVLASQHSTSEEGVAFLRAGDGFACPKCKCWSTLLPSNSFIIIAGKPVAFVGDKFTCGAVLLQKQNLVVGESKKPSTTISKIENNFLDNRNESKDKSILELFWSYGENFIKLDNFSRHYVDINLHVKTKNYNAGEKVEVTIVGLESDIVDGSKELKVSGTVDKNGDVIIKKIFKNNIINI